MRIFSKFRNGQLVGFILILTVLIIGGIFYLPSVLEEKEEITKEEIPEILSFVATVLRINIQENYLTVRTQEEKEIKVNLNEKTEIIQLKFPLDSANPPEGGFFVPEEEIITIKDIIKGDRVVVKSLKNIRGKTEISDVSQIRILP